MATTKETSLDKRQALSLVQHYFEAFQNCCNQPGATPTSALEPYLSRNFHLTSSDHHIAKNLTEYLKHFSQYQQKFTRLEIAGPTAEPLIHGNKIALQYTVDYTLKNGQKNEVFIMAIATIEDNKIASWTQVAHEKGTGLHWKG